MSNLIYLELVPSVKREPFSEKVKQVCRELGIDPNWLMMVMKAESGLKASAKNYQNGRLVAVGLIQFVKPTAESLGTSLERLLSMDMIEQMDYVKKYFSPYKGRIKSYYDLYLINFFPAGIGKSDDWVFETSRQSRRLIASQNKGIDINKDLKITMSEFKQYLRKVVPKEYEQQIFGTSNFM
jgi:hypothetical protein